MPSLTLESLIAAVRVRIQDTGSLTTRRSTIGEEDIKACVSPALALLAQDEPYVSIVEFSGDGTPNYPFSNLPLWADGFSSIRWLEYPAADFVAADYEPTYLTFAEDYNIREQLVSTVATKYLYFMGFSPATDEKVRLAYSTYHTLSGHEEASATTIPSALSSAFADLVASRCFLLLAARYAQQGEPTLGADIVNYGELSRQCRQLAEQWYESYRSVIGGAMSTMGQPQQPPASGWLDWDTNMSWGNDFLFHNRRLR